MPNPIGSLQKLTGEQFFFRKNGWDLVYLFIVIDLFTSSGMGFGFGKYLFI